MKTVSFFLVLVAIIISSCDEKKSSDSEGKEMSIDTNIVKIEPKKKGISYKKIGIIGQAKKEISQWTAFNNLERELNNILEADYRILKTELEVLEEAFKELEESDFPEKLNVPRFKSKLTVLKTFVRKLANEVETNESFDILETTVKQISEEMNAMKEQINELYASDIDTDVLIIEPEPGKEPQE
ncbi:hypothetical protein [Spongiivirga citrea]|uniref:Lipoprotein n=1 Tax=Spongiivirga citrea TaxID=1481457 RepID=A0A6M0CJ37_9FLAO|nr:hypothetical protein [Spongiivirga citrea]NER17958.1 hypothetical protein [Spongiivirga citrea]